MFSSNTQWAPLLAPFYSILFATFIFQNNSSESAITPDVFGENLERDHSQLHTQSLLLLCSVTHFGVDFDVFKPLPDGKTKQGLL